MMNYWEEKKMWSIYKKKLKAFFEFNWDRETKNFVVWDAFKASFEVF